MRASTGRLERPRLSSSSNGRTATGEEQRCGSDASLPVLVLAWALVLGTVLTSVLVLV